MEPHGKSCTLTSYPSTNWWSKQVPLSLDYMLTNVVGFAVDAAVVVVLKRTWGLSGLVVMNLTSGETGRLVIY